MAMNPGDSNCASGLAKEIYDEWTADTARNGLADPLVVSQQGMVKSLVWAIAKWVASDANGAFTPSGSTIPTGPITCTRSDATHYTFTASPAPVKVVLFRNGVLETNFTAASAGGTTTLTLGFSADAQDALIAFYW